MTIANSRLSSTCALVVGTNGPYVPVSSWSMAVSSSAAVAGSGRRFSTNARRGIGPEERLDGIAT
jgi:hypothetical protein